MLNLSDTLTPPAVKRKRNPHRSGARKPAPLVATDSEWDPTVPGKWLSTVIVYETGQTLVFVNEAVPTEVRKRLDAKATELGVEVRYVKRGDDTRLLADGKHRVLMFFSPKDLEYLLGWRWLYNAIMKGFLRQHNNISSTKPCDVDVLDVYGWAGKNKLETLLSFLGVDSSSKGLMDEYKACMWRGLLAKPEDYLTYAVDDGRKLLQAYKAFVTYFRRLQKECLGMSGADLWTEESIPMTTGRLVAETFKRFVFDQAGPYRDALEFCLRKQGVLDRDASKYHASHYHYRRAIERCRCIDDLRKPEHASDIVGMLKARYAFTGLQGGSVKWFASRPTTESAVFLALVNGGRCCNEWPTEYGLDHGLDIDISGCYGASLSSMIYPVGLPRVWSYTPNEPRIRFGSWYQENKDKLVDGLWVAIVKGKLDCEQDLIPSKLVKIKDIAKAARSQERGIQRGMRRGEYYTAEDEDSNIPSDFVLLRREIENGCITSDVLRGLIQVATDQERKQLWDLELVAAAGYLQGDRKPNVQEWCEAILADTGAYAAAAETGGGTVVKDTRSHAWYGIPLKQFIGRLVEERTRWKGIARNPAASDEERTQAKAMQEMLKLVVNTFYGDIASRHFSIGNSIVANNITARARVGVWMVAKALGLRQSITDGGIYDPTRVAFFEGRRPGLSTLSRMDEWHSPARYRRLAPLAGLKDWPERIEKGELPPDLDHLAARHVAAFWAPYGLELPFDLEHKKENSFVRAAYWSKADYALRLPGNPKPKYKLRGKDKEKKDHPTFAILDAILAGEDTFPSGKALQYRKKGLLKIGKYLLIQQSAGYPDAKHLRPGDDMPEEVHPARYNNTWMRMRDVGDYLRRKGRRKMRRGQPVQWFEKNASQGLSGVHSRMLADRL
jgi:hypothetical protein